MKTKLIITVAFLGIALLAGVVIINLDENNNTAVVSAEGFPRNISTRTPYPTAILPGVSIRAMQKFADSGILTAATNGIEMSTANYRVEKEMLKVDVCYQKPNNEEWLIYDASIQILEFRVAK